MRGIRQVNGHQLPGKTRKGTYAPITLLKSLDNAVETGMVGRELYLSRQVK